MRPKSSSTPRKRICNSSWLPNRRSFLPPKPSSMRPWWSIRAALRSTRARRHPTSRASGSTTRALPPITAGSLPTTRRPERSRVSSPSTRVVSPPITTSCPRLRRRSQRRNPSSMTRAPSAIRSKSRRTTSIHVARRPVLKAIRLTIASPRSWTRLPTSSRISCTWWRHLSHRPR